MVAIDLNKYANQNVNVTIENEYYSLTFKSFKGTTLATITRDGETLIEGILCLPNKKIIPYDYLSPKGNFRFDCITDDYPYYTDFGDGCILKWYSAEELSQMEEF